MSLKEEALQKRCSEEQEHSVVQEKHEEVVKRLEGTIQDLNNEIQALNKMVYNFMAFTIRGPLVKFCHLS
mgnify:CR=1 FL=1